MFRKKPEDISRRTRQVVQPSGGARPVFSYHANRSMNAAPRSARTPTWLSAQPAAAAVRPSLKKWPKRVQAGLGLAVLVVLFVLGVSLNRTPNVVVLADTADRQVFLRPVEVYQRAADTALHRSLSSTNKLTIDTASISSDLRRQFPELERVTVTLPFLGRQPTIYMQPVRPTLLLKVPAGGLYVLDTAGRALINASEVRNIAKLHLPVVDDQSSLPVSLGKTALPSSYVAFVTEVVGQLQAKKIAVMAMTLPKGTGELDVRMQGANYVVKYNLRGAARAEVGSYLAVKTYLEREHKTPESYIDVRVDNKAYYR